MIGGALKLASNVLNPDTELSDIKSMRSELQSTMIDISSDLKSIDSGIDTLKTIATETYEMVVDLKHKEGLDLCIYLWGTLANSLLRAVIEKGAELRPLVC